MKLNVAAIDDQWLMDDELRKACRVLFDTESPEDRQRRNREYRRALLLLLQGAIDESAFAVADAYVAADNALLGGVSLEMARRCGQLDDSNS